MHIVFLWATVGRKICAKSVQACIVCKFCAKPEVGADVVQRLCKLCEWNPRRAATATPATTALDAPDAPAQDRLRRRPAARRPRQCRADACRKSPAGEFQPATFRPIIVIAPLKCFRRCSGVSLLASLRALAARRLPEVSSG